MRFGLKNVYIPKARCSLYFKYISEKKSPIKKEKLFYFILLFFVSNKMKRKKENITQIPKCVINTMQIYLPTDTFRVTNAPILPIGTTGST